MGERISSDLLRGHTDTIVLRILMDGDSYGYEIYKKIIEKSEGIYELKGATLYSSFRCNFPFNRFYNKLEIFMDSVYNSSWIRNIDRKLFYGKEKKIKT